MNTLTQIFFWISTGLLVPVMVLLLLGFLYALTLLGGFYGHHADRRRFKKETSAVLDAPIDHLRTDGWEKAFVHHPRFLQVLADTKAHDWCDIHSARALAAFEVSAEKQLERSKTLMRIGPMLGLMGTLIPMGPALVGLASGDIATMAMNMQVAFSTTVIGVFLGATGFVLHNIRRRWFIEDACQLQFVIELMQQAKAESK